MIVDPETLAVFALASMVLIAVPGTAGAALRRSRRFARTQRYVSGGVYVAIGVATAFAGRTKD